MCSTKFTVRPSPHLAPRRRRCRPAGSRLRQRSVGSHPTKPRPEAPVSSHTASKRTRRVRRLVRKPTRRWQAPREPDPHPYQAPRRAAADAGSVSLGLERLSAADVVATPRTQRRPSDRSGPPRRRRPWRSARPGTHHPATAEMAAGATTPGGPTQEDSAAPPPRSRGGGRRS